MEDVLLIDAAERYLRGEMSTQEKEYFEEMRRNNAELDQLVVEKIFFLNELDKYSETKHFTHILNETSSKLAETGFIKKNPLQGKAKVVSLWNKYKKTIAVAASIAGIVSIIGGILTSAFNNNKINNIKPLVEKIKEQDNKYKSLEKKIGQLNSENQSDRPKVESKFRATGFLIDVNNNLLVTNAHVLNEAKNQLFIEDYNGNQFVAKSVFVNAENDLAILQITDKDFKKYSPAPFGIKKNVAELGEQIFTLGYPKQEIVYNEGYVSAKNGYQMDTVFYQISATANEGNSGSPVINKSGDLIGVVSSRETNSDGVIFVIKSSFIQKAINDLKENSLFENIRITTNPSLRGVDRVSQIKKVQDYIFMIKGN